MTRYDDLGALERRRAADRERQARRRTGDRSRALIHDNQAKPSTVAWGDTALTARLSRAARAWLNWSQAELARRTGFTAMDIKLFERGMGRAKPELADKVRHAFATAGVQFIHAPSDNPSGILIIEKE